MNECIAGIRYLEIPYLRRVEKDRAYFLSPKSTERKQSKQKEKDGRKWRRNEVVPEQHSVGEKSNKN